MVKDIAVHSLNTFPGISNPTTYNDKLYYLVTTCNNISDDDKNLWATEGTAIGTILIKDVNPNTYASSKLLARQIIIQLIRTFNFLIKLY